MASSDPGAPAQRSGTPRPVLFATALFLALAVSSAINSGLGALAPLITTDLGISRLQFGVLASIVSLAGGLLSPAGGRLTDRLGGRRALVALFVVAGFGTLLAGAAVGYWSLVLVALVLSVPLALGNPATNLLVVQAVPRSHQGVTVGVKQAGVPASMVLTGLALPPLGLLLGWRAAIQCLALLAVIGLVLTMLSLPARPPAAGRTRARSTGSAEHRALARWFALYAFLMGSGMAAVSAFLPLFAHDALGIAVETAGRLAATIGIFSIASRVAWGYLSERAPSISSVLRWMGLMAFASTMVLVLAIHLDWRLAWLAAAGFGATSAAWHTPIMLAVVREAGQEHAGFVSGRVVQGFLIGKVASPILFGLAVDAGVGYSAAWSVLGLCFVLAAVVQTLRQRWGAGAPGAAPTGMTHNGGPGSL